VQRRRRIAEVFEGDDAAFVAQIADLKASRAEAFAEARSGKLNVQRLPDLANDIFAHRFLEIFDPVAHLSRPRSVENIALRLWTCEFWQAAYAVRPMPDTETAPVAQSRFNGVD
jgi:hypothetical protein